MVPTPPRKTHPNRKVDYFLNHVQEVSRSVWLIASSIASDEQAAGLKGHRQDNRQITYKAEEDRFQMDVICDRGFTYASYLRNQPHQKNMNLGLSSLHAQVFALFDTPRDNFHEHPFVIICK